MDVLETQITQWRSAVSRNRAIAASDVEELESHLREQVADLEETGLTEEEAFLVAVWRLGAVDTVTEEFAREHGDRLWKQLVLAGNTPARRRPLISMIVFAGVAAVAIQVARLASLESNGAPAPWFYRDLGLFVLPILAAYFVWLRQLPRPRVVALAAAAAAVAVIVSIFPFAADSQTGALVGIHLPVVLWFAVGLAYLGAEWRSSARRMDFVRFTGEWAIYYLLIAIGGAILIGLTGLVLGPIIPGSSIDNVFVWVVPSGAAAAMVVAAWLVEAKKSVIENLAPVLAVIFTPLFAVMLVVATVGYLVAGIGHAFDRDLLIAFDVLLLVVLALVLYGISARGSVKAVAVPETLRLIALVAAVALDLLVLGSMLTRIGSYGFTPNRVASLAVNVILLVNLSGTAWLTARALAHRGVAARIDRWQTGYLPVFAAWVVAAVAVLPLVFSFE
jgi:hypothetical protein